jgi:hypothetical protein
MLLKYEEPVFLNEGEVACEPQLTEWECLPNESNRNCLLHVTVWSGAQTGLDTKTTQLGWGGGQPQSILSPETYSK